MFFQQKINLFPFVEKKLNETEIKFPWILTIAQINMMKIKWKYILHLLLFERRVN